MKKTILTFLFFFNFTFLLAQNERLDGILLPIVTLGDVSDIQKQIIENTLIEELTKKYRLVPQDKLEKVQEKIFQEMEYEECTEDQCIILLQEALQVDNLFIIQIIKENANYQLSLSWIGLDDKRMRNQICNNCTTFDLNKRIKLLVNNIESDLKRTPIIIKDPVVKKSIIVENISYEERMERRSDRRTKYFGLSLFNPVQTPDDDWNIRGFRFNLINGHHEYVTGLDLTFIGISSSKVSKGVQLTWVGMNMTENMTGIQVVPAGINYAEEYSSTQFGMIGVNYTNTARYQLIMGINISTESSDFQLGFVNYSHTAKNQIGLINMTKYLEGFQIGFININMNSKVPYGYVLPFFNFSF